MIDSYTQHVINNIIVWSIIVGYPGPMLLFLVQGGYDWHVQRRINGRFIAGLIMLTGCLVIVLAWAEWIQG